MPDVEPRIALDDPVGHDPAHPARTGDPVSAKAAGDEKAGDLRGLAEDELPVGREGFGPVDQPGDLGPGHCRHPPHGALQERRKAVPVRPEQLVVEVGRDPVETPGRRLPLVAANDEASYLLPEIDQVVRVPHRGHAGGDAVERLGRQVVHRPLPGRARPRGADIGA